MQTTNAQTLAGVFVLLAALFKAQKAEAKAQKALKASEAGAAGSAPYIEALVEFKIRQATASALLQLAADQAVTVEAAPAPDSDEDGTNE